VSWLKSLPARIVEAILGAAAAALVGDALGLFDKEHRGVLIALIGGAMVAVSAYILGLRRGGAEEDLFSYYGEHVREVLEVGQKLVAGSLSDVTVQDFVERGILAPACGWLQRDTVEEIRMTVIAPLEGDSSSFGLIWEHGHSLEARERFRLPVPGSFAGYAFSTGETQYSNKVHGDQRWSEHPKARPSRAYGSLISVPIKVGDHVVGVFNVISTYEDAFTRGDITHVEILGSMINVVWGLRAGSRQGPPGPPQSQLDAS
jgi:GAF domain-containing protein